MHRRLQGFRRDESGLTLIEVMVAAFLGLLIVAMLGNMFVATTKSTQIASVADRNTRQASTAMAVMTRYLHAATTLPVSGQLNPSPAFVSGSATDVTFYAYVNLADTTASPVKVRFYIDPTTKVLRQQTWKATVSGGFYTFPASTPSTTTTLTERLASPTSDGKALFSYYNSGMATTSDLSTAGFVGVNLDVGSSTAGAAGNAHLSSTVALLNVGAAGVFDES